ncbi:MAG TPA: TonB family protein [Gammaproteobacteria bacterium]|nr:TonB family protein [Gammaproteobacteria bacterium]
MKNASAEKEQLLERQLQDAKDRLAPMQVEEDEARIAYEQLAVKQQTAYKLEQICAQMADLAQQPALGDKSPFNGAMLEDANEVNQHYSAFIDRINVQVVEFKAKLKEAKQRFETAQQAVSDARAEVRRMAQQLEQLRPMVRTRTLVRTDSDGVERAYVIVFRRNAIMPWNQSPTDESRYRRIRTVTVLVFLLLSLIMPFVPIPEKPKVIVIPERMAKLIQEQKPPPPPPPPKVAEKQPEADDVAKLKPKPTPGAPGLDSKTTAAREKASRAGLLAFSGGFTDLMDNSAEAKLGKQARVTAAGPNSGAKRTERSLITSGVTRGSGGINTAALSRDVAGSGLGSGVRGTSRVTGFIGGSEFGDADKPLAADAIRGSRTDEEIQVVFDRNKSALYSIYQRALRNDPTLKGKVVLKLTIAPSGQVLAASVESSDLGDPDLERKIAARVKLFDFGAKEVDAITITYPIDFLPA